MPEEWRDIVIIPIYKQKGYIQDCGNYKMSHTMKIWERVLERRLREEMTIGEEHFAFMPGRGTIDAVFAAGNGKTSGEAVRTFVKDNLYSLTSRKPMIGYHDNWYGGA